jgi:FKBP-type peptidyl-prolyl cis-trans isomerase SlyD
MSNLRIQDNMAVGMRYVLTVDNEVIDTTDDSSDLFWYLHGHSNIIPGLEFALTGLRAGDKKTVTVAPANAYGEFDDEAFLELPYDEFPEDMELEEGMALTLHNENTDEVVQAFISELSDGVVVVDLNHPLAGETLRFEVQIVEVRAASAEELAHGHVHSDGHEH